MNLFEKTEKITALLRAEYPAALCSLQYEDPFQLLVATRLSAQCTDARVNLVCPGLFARFPTPRAMATADVEDVEALIRTCGFFRVKARDLVAMSGQLCALHNEKVPGDIETLTALPGVGRKTANLICGDVFGLPAVVADTHLIRITNLLGLVATKNPQKVETQLRGLLAPAESNDFCHRCVLHGRAVCIARRPQCGRCVLAPLCDHACSDSSPGIGTPTDAALGSSNMS
ncbi:MAG: endonuclease III [Oscillospiraceae bacterium]|jgi:endonuclease-3|nr:endonuclease III [Oscillospiraceae bacterium]